LIGSAPPLHGRYASSQAKNCVPLRLHSNGAYALATRLDAPPTGTWCSPSAFACPTCYPIRGWTGWCCSARQRHAPPTHGSTIVMATPCLWRTSWMGLP